MTNKSPKRKETKMMKFFSIVYGTEICQSIVMLSSCTAKKKFAHYEMVEKYEEKKSNINKIINF